MRRERVVVPTGSSHHASLEPPTEVRMPKPLMKRSLRWSSRRIRIWEYVCPRAKQYRDRVSFTPKAMETAITEGRWKVPSPPWTSSWPEKAMKMGYTFDKYRMLHIGC